MFQRRPFIHHRRSVAVAAILCSLPVVFSSPGSGLSQTRLGTTGSVVVPISARGYESTVVPEAEARLLAMLNAARRGHHLPPLVMTELLRGVARSHSRDMAVQGYVGHGSALGQSFIARLSRVVPAGTFVGENVTAALTVEEVHGAFIHSQGHLENILGPTFRWVGIGVATAGQLLMVTEDFAD
jgi:uncharacterized protein YkwD